MRCELALFERLRGRADPPVNVSVVCTTPGGKPRSAIHTWLVVPSHSGRAVRYQMWIHVGHDEVRVVGHDLDDLLGRGVTAAHHVMDAMAPDA